MPKKSKNRSPYKTKDIGIPTAHTEVLKAVHEYKQERKAWRRKWQRSGISEMDMVTYYPILGFDSGYQCNRKSMRGHGPCKKTPRAHELFQNETGCSNHQRKSMLSKGAFGKAYKSCCAKKCSYVTKYIDFHGNYKKHDFYREVMYAQVAGRAGVGPKVLECYTTPHQGVIIMEKLQPYELEAAHEQNMELEDPKAIRANAVALARKVGKLIFALHRIGILHHDSHDSNIVKDQKGHWKLIDYGMATEFIGSPEHDVEAIKRDYELTLLFRKDVLPKYTRLQWAYIRNYYRELYRFMEKDIQTYRKQGYRLLYHE